LITKYIENSKNNEMTLCSLPKHSDSSSECDDNANDWTILWQQVEKEG